MESTQGGRPVNTKRVNRAADAARSSRLIVRVVQPVVSDPAETARRLRAICEIGLSGARARQSEPSRSSESCGPVRRSNDARACKA